MRPSRRAIAAIGLAAAAVAALGFTLFAWRAELPFAADAARAAFDPAAVARGTELARVGNCNVCHTRADGSPFAGGRPIETPLGVLFSTLARIPLFVWAMLVTSLVVVFAMPAVMLASSMLIMDRLIGTHFFAPAQGGDALLWQHLFWYFGHPEVYIIFLPATGMVSAIIPAFVRRQIFGYLPLVLSLVAIGFLSFGVWVHHMFVVGLSAARDGHLHGLEHVDRDSKRRSVLLLDRQHLAGTAAVPHPVPVRAGLLLHLRPGGPFRRDDRVRAHRHAGARYVPDLPQVLATRVAHFHYVLIGGAVFPLIGD